MGKLFGTDGIRGIAYDFLTHDFAKSVGEALGMILSEKKDTQRKVLIGADTRISGTMLSDAISEGLNNAGFDTYILGIIPTPAVAYLTKKLGFDAGVMVSASHNPYEYNGIKVFGPRGFKLTDAEEEKIEKLILSSNIMLQACRPGQKHDASELRLKYTDYLTSCTDHDFSGLRIVIDCANGSASATAKDIFGKTGASITYLSSSPDGKNINAGCGSTHLAPLKAKVTDGGYDIGIAFDGDADRCLLVDENGHEIDGDFILAILSLSMKEAGKLASDTVVGTVMANCGFSKFCKDNLIDFVSTKVGDRYVLEEMERCSYSLGGEQSGHIIIREYATTGDGQLTALFMLSALKSSGKKLSELASVMKKYPQCMINIEASPSQKEALKSDEKIQNIIAFTDQELNGSGRLLIRPSGTEPLVRIMIESEDEEKTNTLCRDTAEKIQIALQKY